jgi:hypothetical protein
MVPSTPNYTPRGYSLDIARRDFHSRQHASARAASHSTNQRHLSAPTRSSQPASVRASVGAHRASQAGRSEHQTDLAIDRNQRPGRVQQPEPALDHAVWPEDGGQIRGHRVGRAGGPRRCRWGHGQPSNHTDPRSSSAGLTRFGTTALTRRQKPPGDGTGVWFSITTRSVVALAAPSIRPWDASTDDPRLYNDSERGCRICPAACGLLRC